MDLRSLFDKDEFEDFRRDVVYEIRMVVKTVSEQITNSTGTRSPSNQQEAHIFTSKFYNQANELGLTEQDALAVFYSGESLNEETITREYDGYELRIEHTRDQFSGKPVITSIMRVETVT